MTALQDAVRAAGSIPLLRPLPSAASGGDLADALGAAVVALLAGLPVRAAACGPALAAGGVSAAAASGRIAVWGAGCTGPQAALAGAERRLHAVRGPLTRAALGGGTAAYGDAAWLMPWLHRPEIGTRWELGVVAPPGGFPAGVPAHVRLIEAAAPAGPAALRARLEEMLACRRIAALGAAGLVVAEAYAIPCLPLLPGSAAGLAGFATGPEGGLPFAVADLYGGLGAARVAAFVAPPDAPPDWDALIAAIDRGWTPASLREEDLLESFPLPVAPVAPAPGTDVFDAPVLQPADPPPRRHGGPGASLQDWVDQHGCVPLAWAATSEQSPSPNLGDALSAVMVAAIAGLPLQRRHFDDAGERLVAVGTIGHAQRNGIVHLWGTALDPKRNAFDPTLGRFAVPPATRFAVHATRGRNTAARLREAGVAAPDIYGDPVWFLPRLVGARAVAPRWELGVILHITELDGATPEAAVRADYRRYHIPPALAGAVRIISTFTGQGTEALLDKVDEIRACRRIASTSFHGLVIPESFGIPNLWFSTHPGEGMLVDVDDAEVPMDHRVRDWYSGMKRRRVPIYGGQRHLPTRWDRLMRWIDAAWEPRDPDARALFDAFPLRKSVAFEDASWPMPAEVFGGMTY